jgi:RimJ/RimL family protein N-acetyltransferase
MREQGFRRLYAKIWRDNVSSIKAFERAGWRLEKRFVSVRLHVPHRALLIPLPMKKANQLSS